MVHWFNDTDTVPPAAAVLVWSVVDGLEASFDDEHAAASNANGIVISSIHRAVILILAPIR
jgi:hypothetical protein